MNSIKIPMGGFCSSATEKDILKSNFNFVYLLGIPYIFNGINACKRLMGDVTRAR